MPLIAVHGISLCQSILELPDAVGQDADLVVKDFGVREDETIALSRGQGSFWADSRAALLHAASARKDTAASQLEPSTLCARQGSVATTLL